MYYKKITSLLILIILSGCFNEVKNDSSAKKASNNKISQKTEVTRSIADPQNQVFDNSKNIKNNELEQKNTDKNNLGQSSISIKKNNIIGSVDFVAPKVKSYNLKWIVYFDFDSAEIVKGSLAILRKHAEVLKQNPEFRVKLLGHTDERGSREYNLALGEDRAIAVKKVLNLYGISKIQTVSFGEEKPMYTGRNEKSWWKNRRVEIIYY